MNKLQKLYLAITKDRGEPLDFWEIAALLEVYGIRDIDAKKEYGFEDVFALAKELYRFKNIKEYPKAHLIEAEQLPPLKKRIFKNYIKGLAFAFPIFVQIIATILFGFALWSNTKIDISEATFIALGIFVAMIVTGGPAQVIGRKGLYYLKMHENILAAKIIYRFFGLSLLALLFLGVLFWVFNLIFGIFDAHLFYIFEASFLLLGILFLAIAVFYVFEDYESVVYFILVGVVFVAIFHYLFGISFPDAQFYALALLDVVIIYFGYKKVQKIQQEVEAEGELLPKPSMLLYTLMPFFVYGLFYFIFLITDRVIEWSINGLHSGYFLWFDVIYEIGIDVSMLVFIILMGILEVVVYEFLYRINEKVFYYKLHAYKEFNQDFIDFYKKINKIFIIVALLSIIAIYIFAYILSLFVDEQRFPFTMHSQFVYFVGAIAYAFLTHGLMNALILFSFSRQNVVVKAIVYATIVDFVIGTLLANMFVKYWAVFGLVAGSIVFWYITYSFIKKMFNNLDYYYYSAY
ncbi:hypothetical protein [Nitratiruptor sp. YY09-18]|uniref:hypothetical protein n=1 Tax=Nitratiruptor sp. YY09-18 TaxID=2724901 RepID=UPI0019154C98|nr:hypothetical protein [Nitratiruptor sp. YY09-18]BCD67685.1 polysaccharide biosynthesis protein PelG [Nitratiruptor sp. YY09-18]